MKASARLGAAVAAFGFVFAALPAAAQYANEFVPAKMIKQGTTSQPIVGSGQVKVQVQVNADGSHKVIKVDSSTNSGDNAAALEIAQTLQLPSRSPGNDAGSLVLYVRVQVQRQVAGGAGRRLRRISGGGGGSAASAQIERRFARGNYAQAKTSASRR